MASCTCENPSGVDVCSIYRGKRSCVIVWRSLLSHQQKVTALCWKHTSAVHVLVGNSYIPTQDFSSECSLQKLWPTRVWYNTWLYFHCVMVCLADRLRENWLTVFFMRKPGCNMKMSHFVQSVVQSCVLSIKLSQCRDWIKQTPTCPATTFCTRSTMTEMYITSTGPNWQSPVRETFSGHPKLYWPQTDRHEPNFCFVLYAQHCRPVVESL